MQNSWKEPPEPIWATTESLVFQISLGIRRGCVSAGTHQSCHEGTEWHTAMHGTSWCPKGWQELLHSNFCPTPEGWCLKMEDAGGCFERRLGHGALSLGTGRERQCEGGVGEMQCVKEDMGQQLAGGRSDVGEWEA